MYTVLLFAILYPTQNVYEAFTVYRHHQQVASTSITGKHSREEEESQGTPKKEEEAYEQYIKLINS